MEKQGNDHCIIKDSNGNINKIMQEENNTTTSNNANNIIN